MWEENGLMYLDLTGRRQWRRLHNEELYAVYSSPVIIRVIKSRSMRWTEHVTLSEDRRVK
jgi:hypothetical protein